MYPHKCTCSLRSTGIFVQFFPPIVYIYIYTIFSTENRTNIVPEFFSPTKLVDFVRIEYIATRYVKDDSLQCISASVVESAMHRE